jgi:hypothetical protein
MLLTKKIIMYIILYTTITPNAKLINAKHN